MFGGASLIGLAIKYGTGNLIFDSQNPVLNWLKGVLPYKEVDFCFIFFFFFFFCYLYLKQRERNKKIILV